MTAEKVDILVVDDLPEKLLSIEAILGELDQNLVSVRSGREALRELLNRDFAVILLDVNMPDMDGFETAGLIRQRPRNAETPIIFITSFSDEMHALQGYSLGAVDYVLSPVIPQVLRAKVGTFVDLYRKSEEIKNQAEQRIALAREQAARSAAEDAVRRSNFLAEASTILSSSLHYEGTHQALARLAVPFLADFCVVTLTEDAVRDRRIEAAIVDPTGSPRLLGDTRTIDAEVTEGIETVLQTGKPSLGGAAGASGSDPKKSRDSSRSLMIVPLQARGRTLGAMALRGVRGHDPRMDFSLVEDLAGRAAIALDNARLYWSIQESERRKNEFLAMLAHELRNPLAPIASAVQIIRLKGGNQPDVEWASDVIQRQTTTMARLVDDLLDVSRITRGKVSLQLTPVDMETVVAGAIETIQPLIHERRHELTTELPVCPCWVKGDPTRLAQVVANLLNNACKYTPEGGRIWLILEASADTVCLRVRDSGIGVPPEMLNSIFDLFTQVDRSLDRSRGGLGIGLTLVRSMVEMHHGAVEAISTGLNQGTEFVVRLPRLVEAPKPKKSGERDRPPPIPPAGLRVLVVDDNIDAAESLAMLLRLMGHEVAVAHEGAAALDQTDSFEPEVVFLDIGLPHMNGYEVASHIRRKPGGDAIRLIAVTGYGQKEDRIASREAGFDLHLVKPVAVDSLESVLAAMPRKNDQNHSAAPPQRVSN